MHACVLFVASMSPCACRAWSSCSYCTYFTICSTWQQWPQCSSFHGSSSRASASWPAHACNGLYSIHCCASRCANGSTDAAGMHAGLLSHGVNSVCGPAADATQHLQAAGAVTQAVQAAEVRVQCVKASSSSIFCKTTKLGNHDIPCVKGERRQSAAFAEERNNNKEERMSREPMEPEPSSDQEGQQCC